MSINIRKYISIIFLVLAIIPIVVISKCTTLYGDDFIYATYFSDGLKNFLNMTYNHYINMNGRALVHLLLEVILIFKDSLFFIVIPLLLVLVFVSYYICFFHKKNLNPISFVTVCTLLTLCLSCSILRESLLWMAGAMNYIFPTILALVALYLQKKAINENIFRPLYAIVMFVCGATTEQGGAMAALLSILYILSAFLGGKKIRKSVLFLPLFIILGYLTVLLSPATSTRTVHEAATQAVSVIERLNNIYYIALNRDSSPWVFEITLLMYAVSLRHKSKMVSLTALIAASVSFVLLLSDFTLAAGIFITIALLYICSYLLYKKMHTQRAIVTLTALMSVGMLIFSTTFGYRNILPCLLLLICVSSDIFLECIPKNIFIRYFAVLLIFIITTICAYPVVAGYIGNRKIINENLAAVSSISTASDGIYYNVDINPKYGYNQFISDDYYRRAFRKIYHIDDDTKIYIKGKDFTDLRLNNIHLEYPMYTENNIEYFPLRSVIDAYGGKSVFDEAAKQTRIDINGKKVYYDNVAKIFTADGKTIDAKKFCTDSKKYGRFFEFNQYFTRDIFKEVFSILL